MADVAIVGGGISGLATAWFARRRGLSVIVLEAEGEVGGTIRSTMRDDFLIEAGPTSTLSRGGALDELIEALEIGFEVMEADRRVRRYIVRHDRLVPLPMGPGRFLLSSLFSVGAKLRVLGEPFRRPLRQEESIAQFVRRRLGPEILDWAVDPFVSGVYAGDPERLSLREALPRLHMLEVEHGSLIVGALRHGRGGESGAQPRGRLIAFHRGMQVLPNALARALGDAVHTGAPVQRIAARDGSWLLATPEGEHLARRAVLALPAYRAAALLAPLDRELAETLDFIHYPPVASVALGFERGQVGHRLDGFGALFPRRLGRETLGVIFSSSLFPGRAPDGAVLLTAFIGGTRNPGIREREPAELIERVLADLRPLLRIRGEPVLRQATLWPKAIPQYELGYGERLARIDAGAARWPGLYLAGNWRGGVSLADSVANAARLAARLAQPHP